MFKSGSIVWKFCVSTCDGKLTQRKKIGGFLVLATDYQKKLLNCPYQLTYLGNTHFYYYNSTNHVCFLYYIHMEGYNIQESKANTFA